jgi:galactosylceramidase
LLLHAPPVLGRPAGIGGLSGGGATSRLLVDYAPSVQSDILDYLFKPNYGASLQILKVEVGSEADSTEGAESCHMRTPTDYNVSRGYEWWMMKEAKARNPDILIYALAWGWPGWLGQGTQNPYVNVTATADYMVSWISGAMQEYGIGVDFVGLWNERAFTTDYIVTLRTQLDKAGFNNTKVVCSDDFGWPCAASVLTNATVAAAVWGLGSH